METIIQNLQKVRERIARACERVQRDPTEVELVAVTKTVDAERISAAIRAGVRIIGENRVQEALQKKPNVTVEAQWHMIGHLQTNKVRKALQLFDVIQSLDSLHLAEEIEKQCEKRDRTIDVLIEVNTSGEASKFGIHPQETRAFLGELERFSRISVKGLMTIGPLTDDEQRIRKSFRMLRELFEALRSEPQPHVEMRFLSMGMTDDFEIAIEEGSNMVRIGRAIFGERH